MSRLVAPGVARFAINGTYAAQPVTNIWDMHIESEQGEERADNVAAVAANLLNAWADNILPMLANDYVFTDVSWVDMDSEEGTTGSVVAGGDETLPQPGGAAGAPLPASVAAKVAKTISRTRGRRNGRLYLTGLLEVATDAGAPNHLNAATQADINQRFGLFLTAADENVFNYDSNSVVVHTSMLSPTGVPLDEPRYIGRSTVTGLVVDPLLATQRSRLR